MGHLGDTNDRFPYGNWDTAQNIVTALIYWQPLTTEDD